MSQATSPSANKPHDLERVCRVWRLARSTVYDRRRQVARREAGKQPGERGPKSGILSADEVLEKIQAAIESSPCVGKGCCKVHARLRFSGVRTSPRRTLRPTSFTVQGGAKPRIRRYSLRSLRRRG